MTTMTATSILLCAATKWEAEPLARALSLEPRADGRYEGGGVTLLKTGVGPARAAESLAKLSGSFSFALSVGLAGALQPKMDCGDLVMNAQGLEVELVEAARALAAERGVTLHFGRIASTDSVLSPSEKAKVGAEHRASAVDMESAAVRVWARESGARCLTVRAIMDRVDDRCPAAAPEKDDALSLVRFGLSHFTEIPLLAATGLRQKKAMGKLCDFLPAFLEKLP